MNRVASDHPSVETLRAALARVGRTDRPKLAFDAGHADRLPVGERVRLVVDGRPRHARVETALGGDAPEIRGAYDSPRLARRKDGADRLAGWVEERGLAFGRSVLVDVVVEGFCYGVRVPGERTVYEAVEPPDEDLSAIAERLDRDS